MPPLLSSKYRSKTRGGINSLVWIDDDNSGAVSYYRNDLIYVFQFITVTTRNKFNSPSLRNNLITKQQHPPETFLNVWLRLFFLRWYSVPLPRASTMVSTNKPTGNKILATAPLFLLKTRIRAGGDFSPSPCPLGEGKYNTVAVDLWVAW